MNTKKIMVLIVFGVLVFLFSSTTWAKDPFQRQNRQKNRIQDGIKSGEITRHELFRLKNEQKRIRQYSRRVARDGRMSRHEKRTIASMQERAGKHIYEAKHNRHYQHRTNYRNDRHNRRNPHQKYNQYRKYDQHHRYHYHGRDRCYRSHRGHSKGYSSHGTGYYFSGAWNEPGGFFSFSTGGRW